MKSQQLKVMLLSIVLLAMFGCWLTLTHATTPMVLGYTYPIKEKHFLRWIKARLQQLKDSGAIARWQKQFQHHSLSPLQQVMVWRALPTATKRRIDYYNPTMTVSKDIIAASGRFVAVAGKTFNPLTSIKLTEPLFFYDATNIKQIAWVKQQLKQFHQSGKLILTTGNITEQAKLFKRPVYADQKGRLTQVLGITHVPALMTQEKLRLKIKEVALP